MHLVMFDIDGTLTATTGIDEVCFVQAVKDVLGIEEIDTDLMNYTHVTDEGITAEIIGHHFGRPAKEKELSDIEKKFVKLLKENLARHPASFQPVPGADDLLGLLSSHEDLAVSLATGGWETSARLKLEALDLDMETTPMASSSDAVSREEIMRLSEKRARTAYHVRAFASVVFVGDGVWDLRSAHALGYGFIGRGTDSRARQLEMEGASHIFPDYCDSRKFLHVLEMLQAAGLNSK